MLQNQLSGPSTLSAVSSKRSKIALGNHIGTSSILLIFVVLCFVSFAALSLISANADYTLSRKVADRTKAYYTACNEAEQQIFEQFGTMNASTDNGSDTDSDAYSDTGLDSDYDFSSSAGVLPYTIQYPISDNQWLQVTVSQKEDIKFISEHRIYTDTDSMDYNQSLPVLPGGSISE